MADLIDRECLKAYRSDDTSINKDFCNGWNSAIEAIYVTAKSVSQQKSVWISCKERLPEEKGEYLVTYHPCYWDSVEDDIRVGIDTFRGKNAWAKKKYQKVIAWMQLPEPWKEGE